MSKFHTEILFSDIMYFIFYYFFTQISSSISTFSTRPSKWEENKIEKKYLLPQTKCVCGAHSIHSINYVRHLASSASQHVS